MKLPENTVIARSKLTQYLLTYKSRNDKSEWLASAGYELENWQILKNDLHHLILSYDAIPTEMTEWGQRYEIRGKLPGPNGKSLSVRTIWMIETTTGISKFLTMYPDKRSRNDLQVISGSRPAE